MTRLFKCGITVMTLVLVILSMMVPASMNVSAAVSVDGWGTHASGTTATLNGVWGTSSSDIYACGDSGVIQRYDGTLWSAMSSNVPNALLGIWGSSSSNIFAVGQNGIIVSYNGTDWSPMTSGTSTHLNAVWGSSSDNVFAVGNVGTMLSYNGTSWNPMDSDTTNHLRGIWGSSPTDVFAVGDGGVIISYNGTAWSTMTASSPPKFSAVWGSSSDNVIAVGNGGTIVSYNGTDWPAMTSGIGDDLNAVWGSSFSDVFAVGTHGSILHYDGNPSGSWVVMNSGTSNDLKGIWGINSQNVYVVGRAGTILHFKEDEPVIVSVSPSQGNQSETLSVTIAGSNFLETENVTFGDGIAVDFDIDSDVQITANITIAADALSGPRDVIVTNSDDKSSDPAGVFTIPDPQVTLADPPSGDLGETLVVTICGISLGGTAEVSFGDNITVNDSAVVSPSAVTANITIGSGAATGLRAAYVIILGEESVPFEFTVNVPPSPTVAELSPSSGVQGQTLDVVITGTNLSGATVSFGDNITVSEISNTSTRIEVEITIGAEAATGERAVTVTTPGGETGSDFTVMPAHTVSYASPDAGVQGQTLDVVITGTYFTEFATVSFGDNITVSCNVTSSTEIAVNITIGAAAATGSRDITVTNSGGPAVTLTDGFTVNVPAPTATLISPDSGVQGQTMDVVITGTDLSGATVSFGDNITVNSCNMTSSTEITVNITIDAGAATGARAVTVTTDGGVADAGDFTVNVPEPTATGISPEAGVQGQTMDVVITGTNLTGATVSFGTGITVNSVTIDSENQITVDITIGAAAATGTRAVTVTTPGGETDSVFTVNVPAPTVTGISPDAGVQGQTLDVVITGTNLTGATVSFGTGITINGVTVDSPTQITVDITIGDAASTGARNVSVTTDGGTASLTEVFSVAVPPPTLGQIDVVSGRQGKTLSVVITGTDLDGVTLVSFGDGIAVNSVQVDSPTQITVEITIDKDAEVGSRDVSVTTPGGTESLPDGFSVEKTDDSISPWWWIGLALILLLMGLLFYMLWRKRRKQAGQAA